MQPYTDLVSHRQGGWTQLEGPVVLVPVKAFSGAKERLAPLLGAADRAALARTMAEHVLAAAEPLPVAVVCDDAEVAQWANALGALVLPEPGRGLNGAVESGVARLTAGGAREILVVHADLPLATGFARLTGFDGITLVPDRREDGTNVIGLPAGATFRFAYGAGSFARHQAEAARSGLALRIVREPELEWDVDVPDDLPAGLVPGARP